MPYLINDGWFAIKGAVRERCRQILARTPDSTMVSDADYDFLYGLFQHHDEWTAKAGEGVTRSVPKSSDPDSYRTHPVRLRMPG